MAKLLGPLLSIAAQKAVGKKLTYRESKGQHLVQAYAIPSNPKSDDQTAQRDQIALAVAFWRHELAGTAAGGAWTTAAVAKRRAGSGYQFAASAITKLQDVVTDPSLVTDCVPLDPKAARFELQNLSDYAPGDEAGNFDVWFGASPTALAYKESLPIATPFVTTSMLGAGGDVVFVQLFKDDLPRGGIHEITLLDGEGMGTDYFDNVHILGDIELIGSATGFPTFVPRLDPGDWDFTIANFTVDGAQHALDLSAIVPAGAFAISSMLSVRAAALPRNFRLSRDPVNDLFAAYLEINVANRRTGSSPIVACTPARTISYVAAGGAFSFIDLNITGWFI